MKIILTLSILLAAAATAAAQGMVVGTDPIQGTVTIKSISTTATIDGQIAAVEVLQTIRNTSTHSREVSFLFPIPRDANVTAFDMWIGDQKQEGQLLPADEARKIYNDIVRSQRDPALLEFVGQGVFRTSVFPIGPGEERKLRASYRQLIRKDGGVLRLTVPLSAARFSKDAVEEMSVVVNLSAKEEIKNIYSPSHATTVTRKDDHHAEIRWNAKATRAVTDFDLFWSPDDRALGLSLLTFRPEKDQPGYFLLFASPRVKLDAAAVEPKDVVFVLDRSGSMRIDGKMQQARTALAYCLGKLNAADRFSIVTFSSGVELLSEKLLDATAEHINSAAAHVAQIDAVGGTAIHEGLLSGLKLVSDGAPRLKMIVFLTDGMPTIGERDMKKIVKDVGEANVRRVRIFTFGVGFDVNTTLIDAIARGNSGDSDYIKPSEKLEERIAAFYDKVQNPVLADMKIDFGTVKMRDVQPARLPDLFHGGQVVLAGRYEGSGPTKLTITGTSQGVPRRYDYDVAFEEQSVGDSRAFVEFLWATRQIGALIDQIQLAGSSKELVDEVVRLSTRYGIITEYTAFLVREDVNVRDYDNNGIEAQRQLEELKNDAGARGVNQAQNKKQCQVAEQSRTNEWQNERGETIAIQNCRNVGRKTFYQKKQVWCDLEVDEKSPLQDVAFYSDEFFKLLEERPELNKVAAIGGNILVRSGERQLRLKQ